MMEENEVEEECLNFQRREDVTFESRLVATSFVVWFVGFVMFFV